MCEQSPTASRARKLLSWGIVSFSGLVLLSGAITFGGFLLEMARPSQGRVVEDPVSRFVDCTGLAWPQSAKVIQVGDDHGGWNGDGEFFLVLDADRETLERWLAAVPPWGGSKWQEGAVPNEIAMHCRFGNTHTHSDALSSSDIKYCAEDFKMTDIPWHNGRVLAFNTTTGKVYLSWWDF